MTAHFGQLKNIRFVLKLEGRVELEKSGSRNLFIQSFLLNNILLIVKKWYLEEYFSTKYKILTNKNDEFKNKDSFLANFSMINLTKNMKADL